MSIGFAVFDLRTICVLLGCVTLCVSEKDGLSSSYKALEDRVSTIQAELENLTQANKDDITLSTGSTYIRWGRTTCDGDATVVYKGYAAGPHWGNDGSGSNYMCLHDTPQWSSYVDGFAWRGGIIYGVDYWVRAENDVFSTAANGGRSLDAQTAPCVACFVNSRTSVLVIPARTECPAGWTFEYRGYISSTAAHADHRRSEFVCFDGAPESSESGIGQIKSPIYPTQVACGSLPCSRFIDGWELTCVVCSK